MTMKTRASVAKDVLFLASIKVPKTKIAQKYGINRMTVDRIIKNPATYLGLDKQ